MAKNALYILCILLTSCIDNNAVIIADVLPHVIEVEEAQAFMEQNSDWVLFEISKLAKYDEGHIKGAHRLWRENYSNLADYDFGGMRASKQQLEHLLGKYGVDDETKILLYDTKGNVDVARFAWQLELFGFTNFEFINGGKEAWKMTNLPLTKEVPNLPMGKVFSFKEQQENQALIANKAEVLSAIEDPQIVIIDTREDYEFRAAPFNKNGKLYAYKKGAFDRGAIPSAIHFNWSNTVDLSSNHKLKTIEEIEYDLKNAGVSHDKKIIVYCQSGVRSAHTSFVLRHILGYPNIQNYDGSWIEWSYESVNGNKNIPIKKEIKEERFQVLYKELEKTL